MSMRNLGKPTAFGGPLHSAPALSAPQSGRQQAVAENKGESQLAAFAATTHAGNKTGFGVLTFWIVVAVLVAARIAFLDPSKIKSNATPAGANAASVWNAGESPSVARFARG
jgi:hypothetical protein